MPPLGSKLKAQKVTAMRIEVSLSRGDGCVTAGDEVSVGSSYIAPFKSLLRLRWGAVSTESVIMYLFRQ